MNVQMGSNPDPINGTGDHVRVLFDAVAADWPSKYDTNGPFVSRITLFTNSLKYHVAPGGQVLDLGCGTGELARSMAKGFRMTACDISGEMLKRAVAGDPNDVVNWVQLSTDWQILPFGSGIFDAVVAASVLEYVNQPEHVFRECSRILRPGGVMLCTVPDPRHPIRWLEWLLRIAIRFSNIRVADRNSARLDQYLSYLNASRHRRGVKWWYAIAAKANFRAIASPGNRARRSPLYMLAFERIDRSR